MDSAEEGEAQEPVEKQGGALGAGGEGSKGGDFSKRRSGEWARDREEERPVCGHTHPCPSLTTTRPEISTAEAQSQASPFYSTLTHSLTRRLPPMRSPDLLPNSLHYSGDWITLDDAERTHLRAADLASDSASKQTKREIPRDPNATLRHCMHRAARANERRASQ